MSSYRCPRCGFVAWIDAAACKRCGAAFGRAAAHGRDYDYAAAARLPGWVKLGLFSIKTRRGAVAWLVASALLVPVLFLAAFLLLNVLAEVDAPVALALAALAGGPFVFAPLWYWLSIRWMDAHDAWPARD